MATEKRLIDASVLIRNLTAMKFLYDAIELDGIIKALKEAPTVDAVEVVRCKDCKHWHEETGWCDHHSHFIGAEGEACHPWESSQWKMLNEDDFCSCGERRSNEQAENVRDE